ncbi:MAG: hypothetical protein P8M12_03240 [Flavobacteriales bacterium]|jgi:hypothetical protein|nr:hypothetical protein [Flavobacteriales bacterium]
MRKYIILSIAAITFSLNLISQTSIKFKKQPTSFFYSQLNLHGGFIDEGNGYEFKPAAKGIRNRLSLLGFFRSGKTLQKGYIQKTGIRNACVAISIDYEPSYFLNTKEDGTRTSAFQLRLMDNWIGFGTKKRRVNFWLGNRRVEYGHNPRIDAESNFMNRNSLQVRDLGFWWDLGWFFKAPLVKNPEKRLDITLQLSSGGWLFNGNPSQGTIMFLGSDKEIKDTYMSPTFGNMRYNNTFLSIAHIGSPTYSKSELSGFVIIGNIRDQYNLDSTVFLNRIGIENIYKFGEKIKIGNQFSTGTNHYQDGRNMLTAHLNNSFDWYFAKKFVLSICQYSAIFHDYNNKTNIIDYSIVGGLGYIINQNLKLRINMFYDKEQHWNSRTHNGAYLQLIAGFGKRP